MTLWPKRLKNHTLWGRTYLYSPYKGVPPRGLRTILFRSSVADPDLELRAAGGGGLDLLALSAIFPSVISSFLPKIRGGAGPPLDPPLIVSNISAKVSFYGDKKKKTAKGDLCAVFGCKIDRRFPEKYVMKNHTGFFGGKLHIWFWPCKNPNKFNDWARRLLRKNFKVNECTKVFSNHFENPTSEKIILS